MTQAQRFDVLLDGGEILDPLRGRRVRGDIAIRGERILAVGADLDRRLARTVVDVHGKLVTPGFVDLHGHFYPGVTPTAADPESTCLGTGVTTAVDGGTAGAHTFRGLLEAIERSRVRLLAFLNVSAIGLAVLPASGELIDPALALEEETVAVALAHPTLVCGIKVRMSRRAVKDAQAREILALARRVADRCALPLMVHIWNSPIPLREVFDVLGPGDIATHVFHGDGEMIIDDDGRVHPFVLSAQQRGVAFDLGHAAVGMDLRVARAAIRAGVLPTTLSTDANANRLGRPLYSLPDIVAEFVALGMPLEDAISATTLGPARVLDRSDEFGTLALGSCADVTVFEVQESPVSFRDGSGGLVEGAARLVLSAVFREGRRWEAAGPRRLPFAEPATAITR